jgi:diguanylate cyclase
MTHTPALPGRCDDAIAGVCLLVLLVLALSTRPLLAGAVLPPAIVLLRRRMQVAHLARVATIDVTTGLLNGYGWRISAETIAAGRRDRGTGVLMIDLDHFKAVNDRYGHLAGDAVLAALGGAIAAAIRDGDAAGRFGGDEFVVLLAEITDDELATVAERIRATVAALRIDAAGRPAITGLSVSIGIASSVSDAAVCKIY